MTLPKGFVEKSNNNPHDHDLRKKRDKLELEHEEKKLELEICAEWKTLDPTEYEKRMEWINKWKGMDLDWEKTQQEIQTKQEENYRKFEEAWNNQEQTFWEKQNKNYRSTMGKAKTAFTTIIIMNIAIFTIGVILLGNGIVSAHYNQDPQNYWPYVSGGLGAMSFFSAWFLRPQNYIAKAVGNLVQIDMIFKNHSAEWEFIKFYYRDRLAEMVEASRKGNSDKIAVDPQEIKHLFDRLYESTEKYVRLIEKYVEKPSKDLTDK